VLPGLIDCFVRRRSFWFPSPTGLASAESLWSARLLEDEPVGKGMTPAERGLGGRLVVRTPLRGGCGKALMLIVFRIVLPAVFTPGIFRTFGGDVVGNGAIGRVCVLEGVRRPLLGRGVCNPTCKSAVVGIAPVLFRVFVVGIAGNEVVGGPYDGRDGCGVAAAMLVPALTTQ
jgi:hypothetical protein